MVDLVEDNQDLGVATEAAVPSGKSVKADKICPEGASCECHPDGK